MMMMAAPPSILTSFHMDNQCVGFPFFKKIHAAVAYSLQVTLHAELRRRANSLLACHHRQVDSAIRRYDRLLLKDRIHHRLLGHRHRQRILHPTDIP